MAKFVSANVLDSGIAYIKANVNKIAVISTYTAGDSYATVNGNILAAATGLTTADFTLSSSGNNRLCTGPSSKSATASATGGGATNHIAFLNTTGSEVVWVTTETSGQAITSGNTVNFPNALVYTANQPT